METREQDMAAVDEAAAGETAMEAVVAPGPAEQAESTTRADVEAEADASFAAVEPDASETAGLAEPQADAMAAADASVETGQTGAISGEPLELVELELALGLADIPAAGFDMALRAALASAGGTLLFIMPAGGDDLSVAALSLGSDQGRETFLAILGADGKTVRFEKAAESKHPVAGLAASWTRVMERMPVAA